MSLSSNNSRQVVYTHVPLSPRCVICTGQERWGGEAKLCGWEGNHRSGVTVAPAVLHDRLSGLEMSAVPTLLRGMAPFTLYQRSSDLLYNLFVAVLWPVQSA